MDVKRQGSLSSEYTETEEKEGSGTEKTKDG